MTKQEYLSSIEKHQWIYSYQDVKNGKTNIELLDYILDNNQNFWIVNKITESDEFWGYMVYSQSRDSNKFNFFLNCNYKRQKNTGLVLLPSTFKYLFKPKPFYLAHKNQLASPWQDICQILNDFEVDDNDIGIFGSYLIGFSPEKDVDFVIYGENNLTTIHKNIHQIKKQLGCSDISDEHIEYQFIKHRDAYANCDIKKIISRNWSGLQIKKGVLSTLRFIDYNQTKTPDVKIKNKQNLLCTVIDGLCSACQPRRVLCDFDGDIYTLYSSRWKFQSFANSGDCLKLCCHVDKKKKCLILDDEDSSIQFI